VDHHERGCPISRVLCEKWDKTLPIAPVSHRRISCRFALGFFQIKKPPGFNPGGRVMQGRTDFLYCPLPVSDSDCGLPTVLSNTLYEAFSVPTMLGSKLTVTWQVPPGFSGLAEVLLQGALSL
jgi:hypothetical protein